MKIRQAATAVLLLSVVSLPVNPLLSSTAYAFGLTQSAPAQRTTQAPARQAQGLAPSPYFDRRTRTNLTPTAPPVLRKRPHRHPGHYSRHQTENARANQRIRVNRPQVGSIGLRTQNGRESVRASGPAATQNRSSTPRRIDRSAPHANRDSSGVSFWPRQTVSTIPRTAALRAPQFPYFGPRPGTRHSRLDRNAQRFSLGTGTWFFSAGRWYRPHRSGGFAIVLPPIGLALPFLPIGSEEIDYHGERYYVAGGVTLRQADGEYLVVNAPEVAPSDRSFYIATIDQMAEPTRGQSAQKFGRDLDRCESRAEARSGFDLDHGLASRAEERRYELFSRSMARCLQTAGYSLY